MLEASARLYTESIAHSLHITKRNATRRRPEGHKSTRLIRSDDLCTCRRRARAGFARLHSSLRKYLVFRASSFASTVFAPSKDYALIHCNETADAMRGGQIFDEPFNFSAIPYRLVT
ncbi:hypothetical protein EVAR_79131_1 [Eumeta japonica]|uniref:Uncharacterized protein n=1 Tax=Eumeta variegata TaxID=151549 RepID=A0A4C1UUA9_EUMVA|nr:hypothetical protein EVAR_79131_1 [Eumeta japonica]